MQAGDVVSTEARPLEGFQNPWPNEIINTPFIRCHLKSVQLD